MPDLTPSPSRSPRRVREQRAYQLVVTGGAAATVAVAGTVLWLLGVTGFLIPGLATVVAIVCGVLFNRTVR